MQKLLYGNGIGQRQHHTFWQFNHISNKWIWINQACFKNANFSRLSPHRSEKEIVTGIFNDCHEHHKIFILSLSKKTNRAVNAKSQILYNSGWSEQNVTRTTWMTRPGFKPSLNLLLIDYSMEYNQAQGNNNWIIIHCTFIKLNGAINPPSSISAYWEALITKQLSELHNKIYMHKHKFTVQ